MLACMAFMLSANAWVCNRCRCSTNWSEDAIRCGKCGTPKQTQTQLPDPDPLPAPVPSPPMYVPPTTMYVPPTTREYWTPFQFTICDGLGIPGGYFRHVYGLELGVLYCNSKSVCGLQMGGFWNHVDDMCGLQTGLVNESQRGVLLQAGLFNVVERCDGIQIGGVVNSVNREMHGVRIGYMNSVGSSGVMYGVDVGCFNFGDGDMYGVQLGLGNDLKGHVYGMQIGCFNYARELTGVQLGLFNIIEKSPLPFFPFFNARF